MRVLAQEFGLIACDTYDAGHWLGLNNIRIRFLLLCRLQIVLHMLLLDIGIYIVRLRLSRWQFLEANGLRMQTDF